MSHHILTPDIEAQTLALLTIKMMGNKYPFTSVGFELALPAAYECLQATKKFLAKKEAEAEAEAEKFWASEAGQKRRKEIRTRIAKFNKGQE